MLLGLLAVAVTTHWLFESHNLHVGSFTALASGVVLALVGLIELTLATSE